MKPKIPQITELVEGSKALYEVLNEESESDLACILISASYLDYALASLLKHYFIETSVADKILNPPSGALSTFASRTDLAYCLGLIHKGLYQNLETIGKIRNTLAHSYLSLTFDSPQIAALVHTLTFPKIDQSISIDRDGVKHSESEPFAEVLNPRFKFVVIVVFMVNRLLLTGLATKHREKQEKSWL